MDQHQDETNANQKRKRKNSSRNPLAHARGKQQSHENIWFRRTGAGYHLFVQYYAGQTTGTVANLGDKNDMTLNLPSTTKIPQNNGKGLSRAAKRRKKKKNTATSENGQSVENNNNGSQEQSQQNSNEVTIANPNHPLVQAMKKTAESNSKALALHSFLNSMSQPLPVTFRIRRSLDANAIKELQTQMQQEFSKIVQPLSFGNNLLYQATSCSKSDLKQHPQLKQFLVDTSQTGTIARQEIGSMLPLLALEGVGCFQTTKKLRILDMCASPGSKTLQALEYLGDDQNTKSRILANDVSESRLQALRDAIQRSGMPQGPLDRIGYSCQDARHLSTSKLWDVIVCDVPCSGDGTIRKDPHILELWKPEQGQVLHTLQLQILQRALQLVKPGGTICYSTCSLNPMENEAVVAAALQHYKKTSKGSSGGSEAELLEFPEIPGFQRRPGVSTWRVADYQEAGDNNDNGILLIVVILLNSYKHRYESPPRFSSISTLCYGRYGATTTIAPPPTNTSATTHQTFLLVARCDTICTGYGDYYYQHCHNHGCRQCKQQHVSLEQ